MAITENSVSRLLDSLPAIFQEDREQEDPNFLGRFLLSFERILLGLGETSSSVPEPGLEEIIGGGQVDFGGSGTSAVLGGVERYFESGFKKRLNDEGVIEELFLSETESVPSDFLPWLAGWLALTLREDWNDWQKRELIANASELYRLRGTPKGLKDFLGIYIQHPQLEIEIDEQNTPFQLGVHSQIGIDTFLDGGPPFYFHVHLTLPIADMEERRKQYEIAPAIIDLQKPAHTWYTLTFGMPIFQINVHSQIGVDTVLG